MQSLSSENTRPSSVVIANPTSDEVDQEILVSNKYEDAFEFVNSDDHYPMNTSPKGICLIINNKNFNKTSKVSSNETHQGTPKMPQLSCPNLELKVREGTDRDRDSLRAIFQELGFLVQCYDDLCSCEMVHRLHDISGMDHSRYSIFVCCLLSHGFLGSIYGSDCVSVELSQLLGPVKPSACPSLTGKPKLFFIQACQGENTMSGFQKVSEDSMPTTDDLIPNEADFLISYCTAPGYKAYRDPHKGSPYIAFLTHILRLFAKQLSILDILTKVNNAVSQQFLMTEAKSEPVKQIPAPMYTLRKSLYLDTTNLPTCYSSQISVTGSETSFDSGVADLSAAIIETDYLKISDTSSSKQIDKKNRSYRQQQHDGLPEAQASNQVFTYRLTVYTSDVLGAGTNADVYVKIYGTKSCTKEIRLKKSETYKNPFEQGCADIFTISENASLGDVLKVHIWICKKGIAPDWHLDHLDVLDLQTFVTFSFRCGQWFSDSKGDKKFDRTLVDHNIVHPPEQRPTFLTTYKIFVKTSSHILGAGTDAKVSVVLCGTEGKSDSLYLKKSESHKDPFESGQTDIFTLPQMPWLGKLVKLHVSHDNTGIGPAWHLDYIKVEDSSMKMHFNFLCNSWLSTSDGDRKISRVLYCDQQSSFQPFTSCKTTNYRFSVKTSTDILGAGTDANVYVVLRGSAGESLPMHLKNSRTFKDPFESGQLDEFLFEEVSSVGTLQSLCVWHDNKGFGAAWHLAYIIVEDLCDKKKYHFHCGQWLSKSKEDKKTTRMLHASEVSPTSSKIT